jgi:16S rRNA (cytidine1402-2'-O)-methyltransferase
VEHLRSGKNLALVTDAGTPGISDPGIGLVAKALEEGIRVSPIPGPSAVSAALSVSGMPGEEFIFLGFLSNKAGKRRKALKNLVSEPRTMVFFEAPHRLLSFLSDVRAILGDRHIVMVREMTKVFEEVKWGSVNEVIEEIEEGKIKGECTLVVAGNPGEVEYRTLSEQGKKKLETLLRHKEMSIKDISKLISDEEGLSYRQVYKECLECKRNIEWTRERGTGTEAKNKE